VICKSVFQIVAERPHIFGLDNQRKSQRMTWSIGIWFTLPRPSANTTEESRETVYVPTRQREKLISPMPTI
jgi:hypothetical protein